MNRHERRKQEKLVTRNAGPPKLQLIATSRDPKVEVLKEKLGPPGIPAELHVLAQTPNETRSDIDRLTDSSHRTFQIFATLGKAPSRTQDLKGDLSPEDGASYIMAPSGVEKMQLTGSVGNFEMLKNKAGELSFIQCECIADGIFAARCQFQRAVLPFLDHLSYVNNCPIIVDKLSISDEKNHRQTIDFTGPYRESEIAVDIAVLHEALRPVYSLYREAKNASSNFYKFLCYYKILEGLLNKLRADCIQAAKAEGLTMKIPRQLVPAHPELLDHPLRDHFGKPLKAFFDTVLYPEFRNALAHFETDAHGALDMSDPIHLSNYAGIIFVVELCVRSAIADHEALLSTFTEQKGS